MFCPDTCQSCIRVSAVSYQYFWIFHSQSDPVISEVLLIKQFKKLLYWSFIKPLSFFFFFFYLILLETKLFLAVSQYKFLILKRFCLKLFNIVFKTVFSTALITPVE